MALVIACGGGPDHHAYGFQYWRNPGPFVQYLGVSGATGRFIGFWTVFSNAVYAYSGVENTSLAAAETRCPRRNIPIAVSERSMLNSTSDPADSALGEAHLLACGHLLRLVHLHGWSHRAE